MTFGDFDDADPFDTAPADPVQVARRLHAFRTERGLETINWDQLDPDRRAVLVAVIDRLLAWGRRGGFFR